MTRPEASTSCARARVMLEAYVDGVLGARRVTRLEGHLDSCFSCREELGHAKRVRETLRSLPNQTCPDTVMASVMEKTNALRAPVVSRVSILDRIRSWGQHSWRPSLATAGVAAVVLSILLVARQEPRVQSVSPEELARAETQVKWVMAQLGKISRRTGLVVRDDVIEARVVMPTAKAVGKALVSERPGAAE